MIRSITVRNYGPFKDEQSIEIKPFTLLYGFNSSGKSTLLRTFRFIREPYCSRERLEELGFRSYFDSKEESMIQWTSQLWVAPDIRSKDDFNHWEYQIEWARTTQVETVPNKKEHLDIKIVTPEQTRKITYEPSSDIIIDPFISIDDNWIDEYVEKRHDLEEIIQIKEELKNIIVRIIDDKEIEIVPEKNETLSQNAKDFIDNELVKFLVELNTSASIFIDDYKYFRAHRGVPRPMYTPEEFNEFYGEFWETIKREHNIQAKNSIDEYIYAFNPVCIEQFSLNTFIESYYKNYLSEEEIKLNDLLELNEVNDNNIESISRLRELLILRLFLNKMGYRHYDLIIEHIKGNNYLNQYKVGVKKEGYNKNFFPLTEVGYGLSQILPILCSIAIGKHHCIVQEPESHLNPRSELNFIEILMNLFQYKLLKNSNCIFETHSQVIMLKTLKCNRENNISDYLIRYYFFEKIEELETNRNYSDVKQLPVYEGEIESLPENLFTEIFEIEGLL